MYQAIQGQYRVEQQSTSRIKYIDTAKGICIFLVVLGHCSISNLGLLGVLLMPLFFTLSGFFFKDSGGWLFNRVFSLMFQKTSFKTPEKLIKTRA